MKGLSRKKFLLGRQKFLAASHSTHPKPFKLITTPLVDRFCSCLCLSPIRIVVAVVSFANCQPWFYLRLQPLMALGL
jgi:hypothetical protein